MANNITAPTSGAVPGARPGRPSRPARRSRPRMSPDLLAELAVRLTPRDRWLLRMLYEHRVLTSVQITQLAFGALTTASHRMLELWSLRAVDGRQPFIGAGSAPMHYVLDEAGAAALAAENEVTVAQLGYRRQQAIAILHSARLAHTVGVNGIMAALVAHARTHPSSRLLGWWPEHRCADLWGDLVRPDAYAHWRDGHRELGFFLEYDTGTETIARLATKLTGYLDLAETTGINIPVLFWFPTPDREAHARTALTRAPLPVATAALGHGNAADPAGRLWLPIDREGPRVRLADLTSQPDRHAVLPAGQTCRAEIIDQPVTPMPPLPNDTVRE
jgi:hypothetical protein